MPQNKRESLIYSVMMCFTMVLWMSMYNVTLHMASAQRCFVKDGWDFQLPLCLLSVWTGL